MEATASYLLMLQKIHQLKAKDLEIKPNQLCFGNISKNFTLDNMNKTGPKGSVKLFSVDYNAIDNNDFLDIHRYLMKDTLYKIIFAIIKRMFVVLLTSLINVSSIVNASNHANCVSLSNQRCKIQLALINLHPNEYSQELH